MSNPTLSIIVPVYNEMSCVPELYRRLTVVLRENQINSELIFVNDGSQDESLLLLKELRKRDPYVKILDFSRNFGHQVAVKAGIDYASGDALIIMDADLQDPPEMIPEFISKWREGYDVVLGGRVERKGESFLKKMTAYVYYRMIRSIAHINLSIDVGDFRLITKEVASSLRQIHEKNPYIRGLISWIGFKQITIPIHREKRLSGQTKYSWRKMLRFAWNGITHFSYVPLQICTFLGILVAFICCLWLLWALYVRFVLQIAVPGWTSIMVALLFLGSVQLLTMGIMGSYIARIYDEARSRPLYVLKGKEGF